MIRTWSLLLPFFPPPGLVPPPDLTGAPRLTVPPLGRGTGGIDLSATPGGGVDAMAMPGTGVRTMPGDGTNGTDPVEALTADGALGGGALAETGSYVTTNGYNLSVGWAKEGRLRAAKTLFTPFVEYGRGTYHTYLDDGTHGNGKISYLGAGLMGASNARTDAGRRRRCTVEEYEAAIAVMSLSGRSRPTTAKMPTMRRISASERRGCSARVIH